MDLKAYQSQIRELIPLRQESDFEELLDNILFGESTSNKFLIKMELNRLATPCQRILDLRDKVTDTCNLFEQDTIKHYLTKPTIQVLRNNIDLYGSYTVGVFEAVLDHVALQKERQQKQQQSKLITPEKKEQCEQLALSKKNKRGAARMYYVSEITAISSDGQVFQGQTSDISSTGIKIKLKDDIFLGEGTLIDVTFIGLTLEYNDSALKRPISCNLIKQEYDNGRYLYLNFDGEHKKFSVFISEFIRLNQYKYKIDVHYYYQLAKISALKHAYLGRMSSLPIFLDANTPSPFIFALENNDNKQLLLEWLRDGNNHLAFLFNELRFFKLIKQLKQQQSTTVYSFVHIANDKQYFLCATEEELLEQGLKALFIQTGSVKPSWRVNRLTLSPYTYQAANDYDITESTPALFTQITHIATLHPLTQATTFDLEDALKNKGTTPLNQFVHHSGKNTLPATTFSLFSSELRKEERYQYQSAITISDQDNHYTGQIVDFSCSGLKVKLTQIGSFSIATQLTINLIELQKLSTTFSLSKLRYKVVRTSANNLLHLQVCDQQTLDICQQFFSILIRNNAKHFTCQPLLEKKQPLQKQLIEIAEESFNNAVFFVSRVASRPVICFSAIDIPDHPLHTLFSLNSDNNQELNYYPIANNHVYERLVIEPFKENTENRLLKHAIIYIRAIKYGRNKWKIASFLEEDFNTEQEKLTFIEESELNANFYALQFRLKRLPKIDLNCISSEMRAISRFAIHLTKKLEDELLAVEGMIEISDITPDVINALNKSKR
ncbi:pilus assembly protein PilZ [Psychromonas marina]|uniref:Pilus assembly protein PilZ n=1 Tax=Psychromonas marina TaxID=88364 RepID=A0ABQ6E2P0_9GAMM|nr:PilZ domain-containing protein [Psychromonas marina]GLS91664.1 pilus assembly protein PilZ [Psychromonas marina]